jgi:O-antigen/teichoic acid export membrane protein
MTVAPGARSSMRSDVTLMAATRAFVVLMAAAQSVLVARALGPGGRGALAAVAGFATVLVALGGLGVGSANTYFLLDRPGAQRAIVSNSLWIGACVGGGLSVAGLVLYALLPGVLPGLSGPEVVVALLSVPAMLVALFLQSVLMGQFRTRVYNAIAAVLAALPVLALAVGFLVFDLGVLGTIVVTTAVQYVGLAAYVAVTSEGPILAAFDRPLARQMLRYGLRIYAATTLAFLVIRVDVLLVNGYSGASATGLYTAAVAIADLLYLLPLAVGFSLFPRVADTKQWDLTLRVIRVFGPSYLVLCLLSVALAPAALSLLYGEAFSGAAELYYWLAPGAFALGILSVLSQHFSGIGLPWVLVCTWAAGLLVNVALNLALLPSEGPYVAALSSSVAYVLILAVHLVLFAREIGGWSLLVKGG